MISDNELARIKELKEKHDAVILAHYYVDGDVQAVADYVGDSFFLAKAGQRFFPAATRNLTRKSSP